MRRSAGEGRPATIPHPAHLPGEIEADLCICILINVFLQHIHLLNFHKQVTGLMLCIVGHVVGDNLLHQGQQWFPLRLLCIIQLLPLLSHFSCQMPMDRPRLLEEQSFMGSTSLWVKEFTIWETQYTGTPRQNSNYISEPLQIPKKKRSYLTYS